MKPWLFLTILELESISILTILLLKILQGSAERPEHGRSTAYAECTKCAGDAQRCSSWIEWHGVAQLRTECPERRVSDGRKDGWIIRWIWMEFLSKHIHFTTLFLDFPKFSPQPIWTIWKFSFETENLSCCGRPESSCTTVTPTCFGIFEGNFPNLQRNTGN